MWALLKSLLAQWALFKLLLKALGSLAWLIPVAFLLKAIGLPMLILLAVLALPVFLVLAIVGLPAMAVLVFGVLLLLGFLALLSIGIAVLKIVIPILLVVWLVRWLLRNGRREGTDSV
ncbi:MAG TPA: hypothetical protein VF178_04280 [Gemmatimonadaceae bacterium]